MTSFTCEVCGQLLPFDDSGCAVRILLAVDHEPAVESLIAESMLAAAEIIITRRHGRVAGTTMARRSGPGLGRW